MRATVNSPPSPRCCSAFCRVCSLSLRLPARSEAYGGANRGAPEVMFGNTIRKLSIKRSDLVVSSKIFNHYNNVGMVRTHFSHISPPVLSLIFGLILHCTVQGPNEIGLSRKHLREGMEGILDRLGDGFDYVVSKA